MWKVINVFLLSFILIFLLNVKGALAASTTMELSPQSGSFGKPFPVNVVIDGHGDKFNSAKATLTLSPNLKIQNLAFGDCNFFFIKTPSIQNPSFEGGVLTTSATKCTAYTLTLVPVAKGTGTISFTKAFVRRYGDATNVLSSTQPGTYTLTNAVKVSPVLGTQTTDTSKNGRYTLILKIYSSQDTPVSNATVLLKSVADKKQSQATTDTAGTVQFSDLQKGIYDATVEENNTKVGEDLINVSGTNHVMMIGINLKDQQNEPLLKSINPLLKTLGTSPLLIAGILIVVFIAGIVIALLLTRLKGKKNVAA